MTISLPDALTAAHSEHYGMSIRLWPGGLSFSGFRPADGESFFYRKADFDRSVPYLDALKEFFFAHPFLSWPYRQIRVSCVSPHYTLLPEAIGGAKEQAAFLAFASPGADCRCLSNVLPASGATVVFGLDEAVYAFCSRSLLNPRFYHHITPLLSVWPRQYADGSSRRMYVLLHEELMDIACYAQGRLLFANTFAASTPEDQGYYLLYAWREVGLDQVTDRLYLAGGVAARNRLMDQLRPYLGHIGLMELPSEAYLLGGDLRQAPMDLTLLSICE